MEENKVIHEISVKKVRMEDITLLYPSIYKSVFDEMDPYHSPTIIYLGFLDGEFVGFISGYIHNIITFYIQYAGIVRDKRGKNTLDIWKTGLDEIDKEFPFIICAIENINIPAINLAGKQGFIINGVRQATDGKLYVELIRRRGNHG